MTDGDDQHDEHADDQADEPATADPEQVEEEQQEGRSLISGVASTIAGGASAIAGGASSLAGGAGSVISGGASAIAGGASSIAGGAGSVISGARRLIDERPGARVRRVARGGHEPLANLWDLHPEARRASIRELGLIGVPVDDIRGTAVEGAPQRGGDFLPLRDRRSDDWRARWQRILGAIERLETLPPVELIKFHDGYWVVDGHNRVAAALYNGQVELDAVVEELRLPGMRAEPAPRIAPVLEGSLDLRAAGSGRLTRTAQRPTDLEAASRDRHTHDEPHADPAPAADVTDGEA